MFENKFDLDLKRINSNNYEYVYKLSNGHFRNINMTFITMNGVLWHVDTFYNNNDNLTYYHKSEHVNNASSLKVND